MRLAPTMLAAVLAATLAGAHAATPSTTTIASKSLQDAAQLRDRALADDTAWKVVESLTTDVGPRLAGSEAVARAVQWAAAKF